MAKQQYITAGTKVDFSKKGGKVAHLGECVVVSIKHGRVKCHYELSPVAGEHKGKILTWKLRYDGTAKGELSHYCEIVGTAPKALKEVREKKQAREEKKFEAYKELCWEKDVAPGDIVTITSRKGTYDFKVFEIDLKKTRVKGFRPETPLYQIGSQYPWANFNHPDVKITMKQKNAFDPRTDAQGRKRAAEGAAVGAKRADTRAMKEAFKTRFGF